MIPSENIETIYRSNIQKLYNYAIYLGANKELAMDLIHDIFCKLCTNKKTVLQVDNIEAYLFRSLKNSLLNTYKSKDSNLVELEKSHDKPIRNTDVEDMYISKEEEQQIKAKVEEMLTTLTKRQNEIIYLRYALEYDYAQIAEIMEITPGACRKLMHKAITELRQKFPSCFFLVFMLKDYIFL